MVPFYVSKTLLFYNKTMFKEAGSPGRPSPSTSSSTTRGR